MIAKEVSSKTRLEPDRGHHGARRSLSAGAAASAALTAIGLGLAGCGTTSAAPTAVVRSFAQIEAGKLSLQVAPDGRSATVRVQTDPPTVCAIAWGRSAALGSIADDPAMGGTAIARHVVVLAGLRPGTTYRYRLTATDARGRVYQTLQLASFSTPRASATAPASPAGFGRDIAVGAKVVAVSSQYSAAYAAANAVDGNLATEWSSAGDGNRAFITIDLGRRWAISGVAFVTREMSDGSAITRTFAVVVDGARRYGPFRASSPVEPRVVPVSFRGRVLRFEVVTSTGGNTGAAEIEVFSRG